jgi:hypothetical protein
VVLLAGSRRGLVDLLVARRRVLGRHVDGGAHVLELEVIGLGALLDEARLVLGVACVGHPLNNHALIGGVALLRVVVSL